MLAEYGARTHADVEWADGSAELKAFIDSLGGLWFHGKLNGKAAGAFTSTGGTARWKRDDGGVAVHPDGAPRIHHRAERLHSRKDSSRTWDAIRFVVEFRTEQRQADRGRACGREASGYTHNPGGRSSEARTLKLDVTSCNRTVKAHIGAKRVARLWHR
jgi:multimeric flavodoxin WrbA